MMGLVREEVSDLAWRWREVLVAAAALALSLWVAAQGGYLLVPLGLILAALSLSFGLLALRRLRFRQALGAPGMVEVDEAQVSYMGPATGGFVSLSELVELRLLTLRGRRLWRLKQADGQALLVPVDAAGSEALFDAFGNLPGMDTQTLVQALDPVARAGGSALIGADQTEMKVVWRRRGAGIVRS
jgi:hypothetical protein